MVHQPTRFHTVLHEALRVATGWVGRGEGGRGEGEKHKGEGEGKKKNGGGFLISRYGSMSHATENVSPEVDSSLFLAELCMFT